MTMFTPWTAAPWPKTNFHLEWHHAHHEGQQAQTHARHPPAETRIAPRRSKLASGQATITVQPHMPPWHEPMLKTERILMVDFTATRA
jgi:hypothetical protein